MDNKPVAKISEKDLQKLVDRARWSPHVLVALLTLIFVFFISISYYDRQGFEPWEWILWTICGVIEVAMAIKIFRSYRKHRKRIDVLVDEIRKQKED